MRRSARTLRGIFVLENVALSPTSISKLLVRGLSGSICNASPGEAVSFILDFCNKIKLQLYVNTLCTGCPKFGGIIGMFG